MAGRIFALIAALFVLSAAPAAAQEEGRWLRAESDNFIVYGTLSESRLIQAAQALEDFDQTLRIVTNARAAAAETKLEVYLVRRLADLRILWPGVNETVAGFYRAGAEQIAAFLIYDGQGSQGFGRNSVLFHEYAHHFMLHYFPDAYPRWYVEGFAEFVSTVEIRGRRASVGQPSEGRGSRVEYAGVLPINALLAPERVANQTNRFQAEFYANAWFAVTYLNNHPELRPNFNRYVTALGEGADPIQAFEPAFGMTPQAFEDVLDDFRRSRISVLNFNLPNAPGAVTVTRMPAAANDLLLPVARMRGSVSEDDGAELAAEVERLAAAYPDDPLARIALARAALLRKDRATARTRLEAILAADETHTEARYLLAENMLRATAEENGGMVSYDVLRDVRRELARGFRHNPNHFPTLFLYATTFAGGSEPMNDEQLNVLARSLELAPQSDEIRFLVAHELMVAGEYGSAGAVLRPLLYAPHGGPMAERARALFDAARNNQPPPSLH